jgi:hypothetical protein
VTDFTISRTGRKPDFGASQGFSDHIKIYRIDQPLTAIERLANWASQLSILLSCYSLVVGVSQLGTADKKRKKGRPN